jgi:hypothetical protein
MRFKSYKFQQLAEMEFALNGAIFAGSARGAFKIGAGDQLHFTSPSSTTVTFTAPAVPGGMTFKELKTQIEAHVSGVKVLAVADRIAIVESTPTSGVAVDNAGTASVLQTLQMDALGATGRVYSYPDGVAPATAPFYVNSFFAHGHYLLLVKE